MKNEEFATAVFFFLLFAIHFSLLFCIFAPSYEKTSINNCGYDGAQRQCRAGC